MHQILRFGVETVDVEKELAETNDSVERCADLVTDDLREGRGAQHTVSESYTDTSESCRSVYSLLRIDSSFCLPPLPPSLPLLHGRLPWRSPQTSSP